MTRNIIVGNPETAKVVFTAHYDTCVRLPFPNFITPKSIPIYLLYQLAITFMILIPLFVLAFILGLLTRLLGTVDFAVFFTPLYTILLLLFFWLFFAGPANRHTANDNTSGITTLLDIMAQLPAESRSSAAFIFFDLEEAGLLGSDRYYTKHRKAMQNRLLVNFDCVSDGQHMIFALKKKAAPYAGVLQQAYAGNQQFTTEVLTKGVFYPSDQAKFPLGVGVAALKRGKRTGILYMNRIHTKKDTIYQSENIEFLKDGSIKLVELLRKQ